MKFEAGTITATGSGNGHTFTPDPSGPDVQGVFGISGTLTGVTVVVEGKLRGGSVWYPIKLTDRKSLSQYSGSVAVSDDTTTSWLFDIRGFQQVRAYASAGTLDAVTEFLSGETDDFGGPLPVIQQTVTDSSTFAAGLVIPDSQTLKVGTDSDLTVTWDGSNVIVGQAAANSQIQWGASGAGIDMQLYGDTAGRNLLWDQSADALLFADNAKLAIGTGSDIVLAWDGTDLDVTQATANSSISWGVDGAGIDQIWYLDTASTNITIDQSADSMIFNGAARLVWTGTTGQAEMHLTDNLADALSIEISGSTDLLTFTTTNDAESVSPIGLRKRSSTAVAITGATTLKLSDSGGIFTVGQGSAYDIDLPSPTSGPGCEYFFSLTAPAANNVTITVAGSAATFVGSIISEGQIVVATGSTLTFASGTALLGDSICIRSIATNLYHVIATASALNGITVA